MALFSFGKRPKPKPFGFIPRYYDKDKEELEARLAKYDDTENKAELIKARIKSRLRYHSGSDYSQYQRASKQSNIRLLFIILTLGLASFVILSSDKILNAVTAFTQ